MPQQRWAVSADGGYLANPEISRQFRYNAQPLMKFRQFVRPEPGFGKKKGDTLLFDRVGNVSAVGRKISELEKMPETGVVFSQGSVVVDEWGNSIPWTGKLEDLAEFDVENIFLRTLRDDSAKALDKATADEFKTTLVKAVPIGTTITFNDAGSPGTATASMTAAHIKDIVDAAKSTYMIPQYDGENYICVVSVKLARALKNDSTYENAALYGDPERLFSGEIGRFYGVRFVEESNVLANALGTTTFLAEGVFFGADPVVEGLVQPLEMRAKIPADYGRDKGLAWYFMGGWSLTYDSAAAGEAKVIHITSA